MKRTSGLAAVLAGAILGAAGCDGAPVQGIGPETPPALSISARPAVPTEPALDAPELQLRLAKGMRFPVLKTVRQTIVQGGARGTETVTGFSELELLLAVTVEDIGPDGSVGFGLRFERIAYRQDAGGRRFDFDSSRPATDLPPEAAVYAAMAGDGFSFRIDAERRISDRLDFDLFLDRSLAGVPPTERDRVTSRIAETSGDENIANFVDDSIGLLPLRANYGSRAATGDTWRRERRVVRPVRLFMAETCTLARLDERSAAIDVNGTIGVSETFDPVDESLGAQVRVAGGHSIGACRVDRATGLPLESRIERLVKLRVQPAEGGEFDQLKRVETTIRAFPREPGDGDPA